MTNPQYFLFPFNSIDFVYLLGEEPPRRDAWGHCCQKGMEGGAALYKQQDVIVFVFFKSFLCAGGKPFVSGQTGGASAEHYQRLGEERKRSRRSWRSWRRRRSKEEKEIEGDDEEV